MTNKLQSQIESFANAAGQKIDLDGIIIEVVELATLELDPQNAMGHPQANRDATRRSLEQNGYTKVSIVAWQHNQRIYAGNLTHDILIEAGFTHAPIAWKPEGDATEWQMERFGIQDNQSAKLALWDLPNLNLKIDTLEEFEVTPIDLGFTELDLGEMFPNRNAPPDTEDGETDAEAEWEGMPEFDQPDASGWKTLTVHFENEDDYQEFIKRLDLPLTEKTRMTWYPYQNPNAPNTASVIDES
jgi:hypothetical protein